MRPTGRIFFLALIGGLCLILPAAAQEYRVALVIGNSAYTHARALPNAKRDAEAMAGALKRLGFHVVAGYDLGFKDMWKKLQEFGKEAADADATVFYYAGHGMQLNGKNYLISLDAELTSNNELLRGSIEIDGVLQDKRSRNGVNIIFLDACRDDPISRTIQEPPIQVSRGLAPIRAQSKTYIAFATKPGAVASDGDTGHSPFTEALLRHIATPAIDIDLMMRHVKADVREMTSSKQEPWTANNLTGPFFLRPGPGPEPAVPPKKAKEDAAQVQAACDRSYEEARTSPDRIAALQHHLEKCAGHPSMAEARKALERARDNRSCEQALTERTISALENYLDAHKDGKCAIEVGQVLGQKRRELQRRTEDERQRLEDEQRKLEEKRLVLERQRIEEEKQALEEERRRFAEEQARKKREEHEKRLKEEREREEKQRQRTAEARVPPPDRGGFPLPKRVFACDKNTALGFLHDNGVYGSSKPLNANAYSDTVTWQAPSFRGTSKTRSTVAEEDRRFKEVWPSRNYVTLNSVANPRGNDCEVHVMMRVTRQNDKSRFEGEGRIVFVIRMERDQPVIVSQTIAMDGKTRPR